MSTKRGGSAAGLVALGMVGVGPWGFLFVALMIYAFWWVFLIIIVVLTAFYFAVRYAHAHAAPEAPPAPVVVPKAIMPPEAKPQPTPTPPEQAYLPRWNDSRRKDAKRELKQWQKLFDNSRV